MDHQDLLIWSNRDGRNHFSKAKSMVFGHRLDDRGRINREVQVLTCEGLGVKFPSCYSTDHFLPKVLHHKVLYLLFGYGSNQ